MSKFTGLIAGCCVLLCTGASSAELFVSTTGSDTTGDGTMGAPYASITTALRNAADGDVVTVQPGTYNGRQRLDGQFAQGVTVRSAVPYMARLRHDSGAALICFEGQGITVEGFDIAHAPTNSGALVIQIQDLLGDVNGSGDGSDPVVSRITLRNNIIHDSTNNDLLKVNNGAENVLIEGNLFYNQSGSDEHIDVNSVRNVTIRDNVFFNSTAQTETSSFVVIKDSNGGDDSVLGARDITVRRNIFANYQGNTGQSFLRVGEDGTANFEADGVLIENNLMIGNSTTLMRSSVTVMGSTNVTIRNNTVTGDLPARSYAARLLAFGANQSNQNIAFYNNLWSDPTGTMGTEAFSGVDVFDAPTDQNATLASDNNLYFNGGNVIPADNGQALRFADDGGAVVGDPRLPDASTLSLPVWNGATFADGSATIREAFEALATLGATGPASAALDAARNDQAPRDDLLGLPRDRNPDIGALENLEGFLFADGYED